MDIRERKHRLSPELYHGRVVVSFTACLSDRVPIFNKIEIFNPISQILLNSLNQWICDAHVYLFMPEHCHLLIEGKATDSDLIRFMKDFKQKSGYWLSKNAAGIKWQKDFYDHILRRDEDIKKQVCYILENPIRKGFADNWKEFQFKGSTMYNFNEW